MKILIVITFITLTYIKRNVLGQFGFNLNEAGANGYFSLIGQKVPEHHKAIVEQMKEVINQRWNRNYNYHTELSHTNADLEKAVENVYSFIENIKNREDVQILYDTLKPIMREIPGEEHSAIVLHGFLTRLNYKNDDKMREHWVTILESVAKKMVEINQEFSAFINSLKKKLSVDILAAIQESMQSWPSSYISNTEYTIRVMKEFKDNEPRSYKQLKNYQILVASLSEEALHLTNPMDLYDKIKLSFSNFEDSFLPNFAILNLEHYFSIFTLLLNVNNEAFTAPSTWINAFQTSANKITKIWDDFNRKVTDIIIHIEDSISLLIDDVGQLIRQHYAVQAQKLKPKIDILTNESVVKIDPKQVIIFRNNLSRAIDSMKLLVNKVQTITKALPLVSEINGIKNDNMTFHNILTNVTHEIQKKCIYLDDLLYFRKETMQSRKAWAHQFDKTVDYLKNIQNEFYNYKPIFDLGKRKENKIEKIMEDFVNSLEEYYRIKLSKAKAEIEDLALENDLGDVNASKVKEIAFNLISGLTIMSDIFKRMQSPTGLKSISSYKFIELETGSSKTYYTKCVLLQVEILKFSLVENKFDFQSPEPGWNEFKNNFLSQIPKSVQVLMESDIIAEVQKVIDHYESTFSTDETDETLKILNKIENAVSDLLSATRNENHDNLLSYLNNVVDSGIAIDINDTIDHILNTFTYLRYKQSDIETQSLSLNPLNYFHSLENALKLLSESPIWNAFLFELDEKLSQYDIQRDVSKYNVANLDDWGKADRPQSLTINKDNFLQFLDKLSIGGDIRNVKITNSRLTTIDKVLAITLRSEYKKICDQSGDQIILKGRFMKFSDLVDENNHFRNLCPFNLRNINIFASKTLFIDAILDTSRRQFNISIIAPKWEVLQETRIYLHAKQAQFTHPKARDGQSPGEDGQDGILSGVPGEAGANFFGIGTVFINGQSFVIANYGGVGGRGQDGGNGAKGADGQVVTIEQLNNRKFKSLDRGKRPTVDNLWDRADNYGYKVECGKGDNCDGPTKIQCKCKVWGEKGRKGGDGGNGGPGGIGGKAGRVDIEEVGEEASRIRTHISSGSSGPRGHGGEGGPGGNCNNLTVTYYQQAKKVSGEYRSFEISIGPYSNEEVYNKGSDGEGGY